MKESNKRKKDVVHTWEKYFYVNFIAVVFDVVFEKVKYFSYRL